MWRGHDASLHLLALLLTSCALSVTATFDCEVMFNSSLETTKSGKFTSQNYPKEYPAGHECRYRFRAKDDEVIRIHWLDFQLEKRIVRNNQCLHDYVEIQVWDRQGQQHILGRYCGSRAPPTLETMQTHVLVIFHSSVTKHWRGFAANYSFVREESVPPPPSSIDGRLVDGAHAMAPFCGGRAAGLHDGVITSPGYPETYPANAHCNWLIRVPLGHQIYIRLLDLQLAGSMADCDRAAVFIEDGYRYGILWQPPNRSLIAFDDADKYFRRFCGEAQYYKMQGQKSYLSAGNRMLIRFISLGAPDAVTEQQRETFGTPIGFRLVWTEVKVIGDDVSCDHFYCHGGEYCIDEGSNICGVKRRYCIDKSLVCNGQPNCAETDHSDEENCYSAQILGSGMALFLFLLAVILAVVCHQRKRNHKQLLILRQRHAAEAAPIDLAGTSRPAESAAAVTALPHNYHGYDVAGADDDADDAGQPFLVPNHLPPPAQRRLAPAACLASAAVLLDSDDEREGSSAPPPLPSLPRVRYAAGDQAAAAVVELHRQQQDSCDSGIGGSTLHNAADAHVRSHDLRLRCDAPAGVAAFERTGTSLPPATRVQPPPPPLPTAKALRSGRADGQRRNKSVGFADRPDNEAEVGGATSPWHQLKPALV